MLHYEKMFKVLDETLVEVSIVVIELFDDHNLLSFADHLRTL